MVRWSVQAVNAASPRIALLQVELLGRARLSARIGTAEAAYAVERCLNRLARCAESHGAESVAMLPDGLQARFAVPDAALLAARDMLERICTLVPMKGEKLEVRAAARLSAEDDLSVAPGPGVDLPASAGAGGIVASKRFGDALSPLLRRRLAPLAAGTGGRPVFVLTDAAPPTAAELRRSREPRRVLQIAHRGRSWQVDEARPVLLVGRDPSCDVVLDHAQVSRWHARIEWLEGGFQVVDTSTNGTRLRRDGAEEITLRRSACRLRDGLQGGGQLAIGSVTEAITFLLGADGAGGDPLAAEAHAAQ